MDVNAPGSPNIKTNLLAKIVLEKHIGTRQLNQITVKQIIQIVAKTMHVKEKAILGKGRNMQTALARQICMFLSKKLINLSLSSIGTQIGKRGPGGHPHRGKIGFSDIP